MRPIRGMMMNSAGERPRLRTAEPVRMQSLLPAIASSVSVMRHRATDFAAANGADRLLQGEVALAISEAATNAVKYAYGREEPDGKILLTASVRRGCLEFVVSDRGNGFREGESNGLGLGLHLIAELSSEVKIVEGPAGTRVQMRFTLK